MNNLIKRWEFLITVGFLLAVTVIVQTKYRPERVEVAKVIAQEACSEGKLGMWLVANTINNRAKKWGMSFYDVVTQENQYYGYTAKTKELRYKECKKNADMIVNRLYEDKLEDFTKGAIYYLLPYEGKKEWHKIKTIQYKNHTFYREE